MQLAPKQTIEDNLIERWQLEDVADEIFLIDDEATFEIDDEEDEEEEFYEEYIKE